MFEHDRNDENRETRSSGLSSYESQADSPMEYRTTQDPGWASTVSPLPPQKTKSSFGWAKALGLCALVAVVAFVGGYAGIRMGYRGLDRVIIKEVGSNDGGGKNDGSGDASGNTDAQPLNSQGVAEKAVPSVVAIRTEAMTTGNYWFGSQVTSGAGSGVIISKDGYIITNSHVVDGADSITVELSDGTTHKAKLVGSYTNGDIAVVKIDAADLPAAAFAAMNTVHQGEAVYAVGNPEGEFSGSITGGILSALNRQISVSVEVESSGGNYGGHFGGGNMTTTRTITLDVLQFDAAVSPGNSGGGLFDSDGNLVGIVCAKSSDTDSEGLGFAIPADRAQEIATALINNGSYQPEGNEGESGSATNTNKAILGISAAYLDSATAQQYGYRSAGVYVVEITVQSTYQSGLRVGDRIISIDGTVVEDLDAVTGYLADKAPGDKVELLVERQNKTANLTITLVENTTTNE